MEVENQGFHITEKKEEQTKGLSLLLIVLTIGGFAFSLQAMFHAEMSYIPSFLSVLIFSGIVYAGFRKQGAKEKAIIIIYTLAVIIAALLFQRYFLAGAMDFLNQIIANINYITGWSTEYFVVPRCDNMVLAFHLFFGCFLAAISLYLGYAIVRKHWLPVVIFWLPVLFAAVFFEMKTAEVVCALAAVSIIGCFGYSQTQVREEKIYAATLIAITVVIALAAYFLMGSSLYEPNSNIAQFKEYIIEQVDTAKFGEQDFPEGKTSRGIGGNEDIRLAVTSDKSGKMYLKAYVGSVYKDGNWELLDGKKYSEKYEGMFQKYQKEEFHPLSQLHSYIKVSQGKTSNVISCDVAKVSIVNENAYQKYVYLPYGASYESVQKVNAYHQDLNLTKTLLENTAQEQDEYEVDMTVQDDILGYTGASWLSTEASNGQGSGTYRDIEADYRKFVYENYMDITKEQEETVLPYVSFESEDLAAFTDALRKNLKNQGQQDGNWDALRYTTMGTLAFRYAGIPARYVEGYEVVTDGTPASSGKYITYVTGENAHAWVEIYKNGIGWIPVDVTPGHYENLKQKNMNSEEQVEKEKTNTVQGVSRRQEEKEEEENENEPWNWGRIVLVILMALAAVILLSIAVILIRWRLIWLRRSRIMSQDNQELAFREVVAFLSDLTAYLSIPEEELPQEIVGMLRAFWFMPGAAASTTKEQVGILCEYAGQKQEVMIQNVRIWSRLKLRFLDCLEFPFDAGLSL